MVSFQEFKCKYFFNRLYFTIFIQELKSNIVMKFTALLPIKSESQRVPNKNFKSLNKKALFKWILEKLISIHQIDQIIINTDAVKKVQ